ncbi:MAG: hypothetical protein PHV34_14100 [Verrucomicrobiae bacterium]|nr:hypothetical protein [Verrucomicrobiae bacterium]
MNVISRTGNGLDGGGCKILLDLTGAGLTPFLSALLGRFIRMGRAHAVLCSSEDMDADVFPKDALPPSGVMKNNQETFDLRLRLLLARRLAAKPEKRFFPHELFYAALRLPHGCGALGRTFPRGWMKSMAELGLPLFMPGWEESTLGDLLLGWFFGGQLKDFRMARTSGEYIHGLSEWMSAAWASGGVGVLRIVRLETAGLSSVAMTSSEPCIPEIQDQSAMTERPGNAWFLSWKNSRSTREYRAVLDQVSLIKQWIDGVTQGMHLRNEQPAKQGGGLPILTESRE